MERISINIGSSLHQYQKGLKIWLKKQPYLTELDYLDSKVIPETKKQINQLQDHVVKYSEEDKCDIKIGGLEPTIFTERSFWLAEEKEYLLWLQERKAELERPCKLGERSFTWKGSQAQLEALCQALNEAGYINTIKEAFTAIFASELIKDQPVQWFGSNRLLSYLFNQMNSGNNPLILSQDWQSIIEKYQLIKNKKGKMLKAGDLSTALSNINDINTGMEPKGHERIDKILKNIKTLRP